MVLLSFGYFGRAPKTLIQERKGVVKISKTKNHYFWKRLFFFKQYLTLLSISAIQFRDLSFTNRQNNSE